MSQPYQALLLATPIGKLRRVPCLRRRSSWATFNSAVEETIKPRSFLNLSPDRIALRAAQAIKPGFSAVALFRWLPQAKSTSLSKHDSISGWRGRALFLAPLASAFPVRRPIHFAPPPSSARSSFRHPLKLPPPCIPRPTTAAQTLYQCGGLAGRREKGFSTFDGCVAVLKDLP